MYTLPELLTMIDDTFASINTHREDANGLLMDANRLSTIMYNLAPLWVEARSRANTLEASFKDKIDESYLRLKRDSEVTDQMAQSESRHEHREVRQSWIDAKRMEHTLSTLREDVDRKVSVIQSYARELSSQQFKRT